MWTVLAVYAGVFLIAPPKALLVVDEERYVSQAVAFAESGRAIEGAGREYAGVDHLVMSDYPPGTSLLQTPFVAAFGWRYAGLASVLALVLATLATGRLLSLHGRDPRFALVVPGFIGAAFFARIGMSDVPSAMVVALALWQLREARAGNARAAVIGGLLAGASIVFRELNILLLAPFLLAALWRRDTNAVPMMVGVVAGLALRPLSSWLLFGNALYVRDSIYGFSVSNLIAALPLWGLILLVLFPGALLLPVLYRGEERASAVTAFVLYFGLYASYGYDALAENGLLKGALLTSRYAVPALPLLALMAADVWPRLVARLGERADRVARRLVPVAAVGVAVLGGGVQFAARAQEQVAANVIDPLYASSDPALPLVINELALVKYASPVYGLRQILYKRDVDTLSAVRIAATETFVVALLDRFDSEMFEADVTSNQAFLDKLIAGCSVGELHDGNPASWSRLRIYRVSDCREGN
jgi:4-amino-4-deoxy-L-arabinose transferase-like glycosyltransferase